MLSDAAAQPIQYVLQIYNLDLLGSWRMSNSGQVDWGKIKDQSFNTQSFSEQQDNNF